MGSGSLALAICSSLTDFGIDTYPLRLFLPCYGPLQVSPSGKVGAFPTLHQWGYWYNEHTCAFAAHLGNRRSIHGATAPSLSILSQPSTTLQSPSQARFQPQSRPSPNREGRLIPHIFRLFYCINSIPYQRQIIAQFMREIMPLLDRIGEGRTPSRSSWMHGV